MNPHTWWLYFVAVFLLSGTPGPNMLHVMQRSVSVGVRRSIATMSGLLLAVIATLVASAAGLGALLLASPRVFEVLKYIGVAYLLYLGIKAWRSDEAPVDVAQGPIRASRSATVLFRDGFVIGISNPKLILFATAFLPQFVDGGGSKLLQFGILVATFVAVEAFWYSVYALGGSRLSACLVAPGRRKLFDRITGGIFVGFGVMLLRARP